jgi:hypothetical protein
MVHTEPTTAPARKVNNVPQREAETREEKLLLGFLKQEVERIGYGTVVLEFTIRNGRLTHIKSTEINRTFMVGDNSA